MKNLSLVLLFLIGTLGCENRTNNSTLEHDEKNNYYQLSYFKSLEELNRTRPELAIKTFTASSLTNDDYLRIDIFDSETKRSDQSNHLYKEEFKISGKAENEPGFLIFAEWQIQDEKLTESFIKSREELFELRQELLASFSFDILTRNLDRPNQYLILGFYKNEDGLEQARNNDTISEWAKENTASNYSAKDLFTPKRFKIINKIE